MGSLWLILLQNSHSLLYVIIVAYSPFQQPLIVIQDNCGLFSFSTSIHCYMRTCGLFSFSTAIHCYIGSLWLILLFNSHSLLYRIIVAYFPFQQPLIVIQDHCGLFSLQNSHSFIVICELVAYSPLEQPFIVIQDHCGLFSFSTAIHCYIGSLWLILLQNSHSLLYANLWLILLFNSHSLLYRIIVAYSPFQQPFIVIQDHCGIFSFRTFTHCYMGSLWLILLQNSHSLLYVKLWLILLFSSHSLLYRIIVAYFRFQHPFIVICELVPYSPFQQPSIVIQDNCGLFSFSTAIHCYIGSLWLIFLQNIHSLLYG